MQWPPEDSECYAGLPEPGTAAQWTEGGFETIFRTCDKISPSTKARSEVDILGGSPLILGGSDDLFLLILLLLLRLTGGG